MFTPGLDTWSLRFSRGPLPVTMAWTKKPNLEQHETFSASSKPDDVLLRQLHASQIVRASDLASRKSFGAPREVGVLTWRTWRVCRS